MGRDQRPPFTRHGVMRGIMPLALSFAVLLAGCGGHANVQVNSGGAPASGASSGASVNIQGRSAFGNLLAIVFLVGVSSDGGYAGRVRVPADWVVPMPEIGRAHV